MLSGVFWSAWIAWLRIWFVSLIRASSLFLMISEMSMAGCYLRTVRMSSDLLSGSMASVMSSLVNGRSLSSILRRPISQM